MSQRSDTGIDDGTGLINVMLDSFSLWDHDVILIINLSFMHTFNIQ